jgi:hypothetical protein
MADSTISQLPRVASALTTDIIPLARLSTATTQGITPQILHDYYVLGRGGAATNINNSAVTTSIYSCAIPANVMGTNRTVRTRLNGEFWHSAGGTTTLNIRVGLSTTTMWLDTSAALAVSASSRPVFIDLDLVNLGATNSQALGGVIRIGSPGATTGQGDLATTAAVVTPITGTAAIDTTASGVTLDVFIAHSLASTLVTYRHWAGYTELV